MSCDESESLVNVVQGLKILKDHNEHVYHEFINLEEEIDINDFPHKQSFNIKNYAYIIVRKITEESKTC